jgi:ATP adenylyltransferase
MAYISELDPADKPGDAGKDAGCFLCDAANEGNAEAEMDRLLVLKRDDRGILMLNRYPYTNGHLLAAPHDHVGDISDLTAAQRAGVMELSDLGVRLLRTTMQPQGINIGMNLGRCAGAGLPGHAHMHVVPRWNGDVNFMQTVGQIRVIPQALDESFKMLKTALSTLSSGK